MRVGPLVVCGAALGAVVSLAACSLVLAGDLDAAHGGEADAADSSSSSGKPTIEAGPDARSSSSSSSSGDAANESGPAATGGCASYNPAPKFCADFDGPRPLDSWFLNDENGTSVMTQDAPFSAPNALRVISNKRATEACKYSRLEQNIEQIGFKTITATVRLKLQSPWPNGMIPWVFALYKKDSPNFCTALYYMYAGENGKIHSASINVQSNAMENHLLALNGYPSTDEWAELKAVISPRPGGGAIWETTIVDADGNTVTTTNEFPECGEWDSVGLNAGVHCEWRGATMYYDDIRVDWN